MTADNEPDVMQQPWCCLECSATFRWGQIRMLRGALRCPRCESMNLHPADGTSHDLESYSGEIGTLN